MVDIMTVEFHTPVPLDQFVDLALKDIDECADLYLTYLRSPEKTLSQLCDPSLEKMMHKPGVTEHYLTDIKPELRIAALLLIRDYWPPRDSLTAACIRVACADSVPRVRG